MRLAIFWLLWLPLAAHTSVLNRDIRKNYDVFWSNGNNPNWRINNNKDIIDDEFVINTSTAKSSDVTFHSLDYTFKDDEFLLPSKYSKDLSSQVTFKADDNKFVDDEFVMDFPTTEHLKHTSSHVTYQSDNSKLLDKEFFKPKPVVDDHFVIDIFPKEPSMLHYGKINFLAFLRDSLRKKPASNSINIEEITSEESIDYSSTTEETTEDYYEDYEELIETDLTKHPKWNEVNNDGDCGRSKLQTTRKSIGGHNADLGAYPWMVRLIYRSFRKDSEKGACGGTLINKYHVITAAHCCITDKDFVLSYVRLGEYDIHSPRDCFRGKCAPRSVDVRVMYVMNHPHHDGKTFLNDICLIRLGEKIEFNDYIQPICLPSKIETDEKDTIYKNTSVAGWGTIENDPANRIPDVLQELNVTTWPMAICNSLFGMEFAWKRQICAGERVSAHSPCPGDSGGPLMFKDPTRDGRQVLMGVVSAGIPCSQKELMPTPAIFTRVSSMMLWILKNV